MLRRLAVTAGLIGSLLFGGASVNAQPRMPGGSTSPADRLQARLAEAVQLMEANRPDEAIERFEQLAVTGGEDGRAQALRHIAGLLANQLKGSFVARQHAWLDRQVLDTVVLVPDESSFLEALRRWDGRRFFPILIEDGWFTPMFVRAFDPSRVVRWSAEADLPPVDERLSDAIDRHHQSIGRRGGDEPAPPGLVVLDSTAPQRLAGLALAIGRGQPIFIREAEHRLTETVSEAHAAALNQAVMHRSLQHGMVSSKQWFGLSLAGDYPYRYRKDGTDGVLAVDDYLGRTQQGVRLAVTGRLQGDAVRSVYQAMASLFLQPDDALLFDDYTNRGGGDFDRYRFTHAAPILEQRVDVAYVTDEQVTARQFRQLTRGPEAFDWIWVNSSGGVHYWDLAGRRAAPADMAIGHAYLMYIVHSFSAAAPHRPDTLAGRAIAGGAWWYFGSVHEPYLNAFVLPTGFALKTAAGTPLAFAARRTPGHPLYRPWKTFLVGDPLFALRDEPAERKPGVPLDEARPIPEDASLRDRAVLGRTDLAQAAMAALEDPADLTPGDLAQACYQLTLAPGAGARLAELPAAEARRHPIAAALVREAVLRRFDEAAADEDVTAATPLISRMLALASDADDLSTRLKRWMVMMARVGQDDAAAGYLRRYAEMKASPAARRAIDRALPDPADAPQP